MKNSKYIICFTLLFCCFMIFFSSLLHAETKENGEIAEQNKQLTSDLDEETIWTSKPIEISEVDIQVLDKISGKSLKIHTKVNEQVVVDDLIITLKRCFKSNPNTTKEIYAYLVISENEKTIFSKWVVASSPSINLFAHPIYDIRVVF